MAAIHVNFIMIGLQYRFKVSVYQLSVQSEVSTYNWSICIKFAPSSVEATPPHRRTIVKESGVFWRLGAIIILTIVRQLGWRHKQAKEKAQS